MWGAADLPRKSKKNPTGRQQREREHGYVVLQGEIHACLGVVRNAAPVVSRVSGAEFIHHIGTEDMRLSNRDAASIANGRAARTDESIETARIGIRRIGHRKPAGERIGVSHPLIDLHVELIVVVRPRRDSKVIARLRVRPAEVRGRQKVQSRRGPGMNEALRYLVTRQRSADHRTRWTNPSSSRIEDDRLVGGEVALTKRDRWNV